MSTQANPNVAKAAEALLPMVSEKMAEKFASKEDVTKATAGITTKIGEVAADLTAKILEIKAAAPAILTKKAWKVRSNITGQTRDMEYSLSRLLYVQNFLQKNHAFPSEKEFGHEVEYVQGVQKAVSEGTSTSGGALIPQEWTDFVIPELGPQVVVMRAKPNVLPMAHQILNVPGLTNTGSFSWIGENAAIATDATPTTNNTTLTLRTGAGLVQVSIQWLRDATPETDAALQANLVRGLARFCDAGYLNGTGTLQPVGLSQVASIPTIYAGNGAANGSTILYDDFSNAIATLEAANAPREGRAWFMNTRTLNEVRLLKDTLGRPLFIDNLQRDNYVGSAAAITDLTRTEDGWILGYPVYTTTQIPSNLTRGTSNTASYVLFAAMSDVYVGQGVKSQGMEVAISDQALFTQAAVAIRLLYRTDIVPGHLGSLVLIGGVN